MSQRTKVAVLISGRGSNLKALLENAQDYSITTIISDNPNAGGLEYAQQYSINAQVINPSNFAKKSEFRTALLQTAKNSNCDLIALAGFMQILKEDFVNHFFGRLINIHPSLLPAYPGLHTHQRAIEAKSTQHGCTVHYVDNGMDTGPKIAQASLQVLANDDENTLSQRVLKLEHKIYPWALNQIAKGEISLVDSQVKYSSHAQSSAKENDFLIFNK